MRTRGRRRRFSIRPAGRSRITSPQRSFSSTRASWASAGRLRSSACRWIRATRNRCCTSPRSRPPWRRAGLHDSERRMDFSWTREQLAARDEVVRCAREKLNQDVVRRDRDEVCAADDWKQCAALGLLAWNVPPEYGGQARDVLTAVFLLEWLGYGCHDNGLALAVNSQLWTIHEPILTFGTEEQKWRYLPKLCAGEIHA